MTFHHEYLLLSLNILHSKCIFLLLLNTMAYLFLIHLSTIVKITIKYSSTWTIIKNMCEIYINEIKKWSIHHTVIFCVFMVKFLFTSLYISDSSSQNNKSWMCFFSQWIFWHKNLSCVDEKGVILVFFEWKNVAKVNHMKILDIKPFLQTLIAIQKVYLVSFITKYSKEKDWLYKPKKKISH